MRKIKKLYFNLVKQDKKNTRKKRKYVIHNKNTHTRIIHILNIYSDLQLYEGGPLSFSSESQTDETSFEY